MPRNVLLVKSRRQTAILALSLLVLLPLPARAESTSGALTARELTALVRSPSTHAKTADATVIGTGPVVKVIVMKDGSASESDMKIDAVFLAKALIDGSAGQVTGAEVLFMQEGRDDRFVTIDKAIVNDYGSGKLTPEKLLSSLSLTAVHPESAPDVADGPLMERRLLVWKRIDRMKKQGTGVAPFLEIFRQIEASLKTSDSDALNQKLSSLEAKVKEQEERIQLAKKSQQGHGVPAASRAETPASAAAPAQVPVATQPPHGQGAGPPNQMPGGQANNRNQPTLWGQGGSNNNNLPPLPPPPGGFPPPPPQ